MKSKQYFVIAALCTLLFGSAHAQNTWTQKADFGGTARFGAVGFSIEGKGYIGTGSDIGDPGPCKSLWQYDPTTDSWTQKADLPGEGRRFATGFSIGSKGYIGTGQTASNGYTDDFWEYDSGANTWTQKANFPGGKRQLACAFSIGSKGYIGGGSTTGIKKDFWEYDASTDHWTQIADFGGGKREAPIAFTVNSKAYVGTGRDGSFLFRKDFWEYDPVTNQWTQKSDFAGSERGDAVGLSIGELGYLGLGYSFSSDSGSRFFNDFWQYDVSSDSWIKKSDFVGQKREFAVGFSIGNKGYIGTGSNDSDFYNPWLSDFWEYTPSCIPPSTLTNTNITNSKATLSWNAVNGAMRYKVRYRVAGNNPWTNVGSTTTTKKINELTANTTYQWQVRTVCSIDPSVSSDWSAKQSFSTSMRLSEEEEISRTQVYPNPLTSSSTLSFSLEKNSHTIIELFDVAGRKISTLLDQQLDAGNHTLFLHRESLPAGVYFIKMKMEDEVKVVKVAVE